MDQTVNYGLSQWEKADRIQMENFNSDNAKIDAALKASADAVASHTTAIAKLGNCKVVYGSYTGTGTYGIGNENQLTFSYQPFLVIVEPETVNNNSDQRLRMLVNVPYAVGLAGDYKFTNTVSWSSRSVQWYSSGSATGQLNTKDAVYRYVALLATDAQ